MIMMIMTNEWRSQWNEIHKIDDEMHEFIICHFDISGTKIRHLVLLVLKDNKFSFSLPSCLTICRYMMIKWTQWIINSFKHKQEHLNISQVIASLIALRLCIIFTKIRSYDIIRIWLLMYTMMTYLSIMECDLVKNTIKEVLSHISPPFVGLINSKVEIERLWKKWWYYVYVRRSSLLTQYYLSFNQPTFSFWQFESIMIDECSCLRMFVGYSIE